MRLQRPLGEVIRADPDVEGFASWTAARVARQRANRKYRPLFYRVEAARRAGATASQIIDRLRPGDRRGSG